VRESESLGFQLLDWIETYLVHGPGDVEGEPLILDDEFAAFVVRAYAVDKAGDRLIRRAVLSRPKGRAKSELAAMLAAAESIGPVRFDHFAVKGETSPWGYEFAVGEPVGRTVKRPEVLCFATEEGQSGNTYDAIRYMLSADTGSAALVQDFGKIDVGLTRILLPGGGIVSPESAADSSKDGGKSTFCVFDETHLWVHPRLKRMHQIVLRNLLKRKAAAGWAMETTTMFAPGEGSVAEGTFDFWRQTVEGRIKDTSLLVDHKQAGSKHDPAKKKDRIAGLKEVYGPASAWMDLDAIARSYDDPQTSAAEWQRYWWNLPVSIQGGWLSQKAWDECHDPRAIPDGARVVLALDGSFRDDSTALAVVQVGEFPHLSVAGLWEKPTDDHDWRVPILDVEEAIRTACLRWEVVEVTADPYRWARSLELLADEGIPVVEFPQTAARMSPATQRFTDYVNQRQLTHDGNPSLARHVSNAVLRSDSRGTRLHKEGRMSAKKIDLAVASIMALERALHFEEAVPSTPQFFV
jgi:phage terminase large subunit-like protein